MEDNIMIIGVEERKTKRERREKGMNN